MLIIAVPPLIGWRSSLSDGSKCKECNEQNGDIEGKLDRCFSNQHCCYREDPALFFSDFTHQNSNSPYKQKQPFILGNFYANGVPNSALHVFSRYFKMLKDNFASARISKFCSFIDKMGNNDRKWSLA
jgi:hypothetical protein